MNDMSLGMLHCKKQYLLMLHKQLYVLPNHCSSAIPECLSVQQLKNFELKYHQPEIVKRKPIISVIQMHGLQYILTLTFSNAKSGVSTTSYLRTDVTFY